MKLKLFPKDDTFYSQFTQQVHMVVEASLLFHQIASCWPEGRSRVAEMEALEDRGDAHTRALIEHLNRSFVTPVDREDIHGIAVLTDDILDLFQSVAVRMSLYDMQNLHPSVERMAEILVRCAEVLSKAIAGLSHMDNISTLFKEMQELENEGDNVNRAALAELYRGCDSVQGVVDLMKAKDVISRLEDAVDKFKKVFELLQQVIIKNA